MQEYDTIAHIVLVDIKEGVDILLAFLPLILLVVMTLLAHM
jgi:hypothetical protein